MPDNITDSRFNEYFGFTQEEVDQILTDANVSGKAEEVKRWYDGYHFGRFDVYCPWDVMNYMRDLQQNPEAAPASYWKNTSDDAVIRSFIEYAGSNITKKLETLLARLRHRIFQKALSVKENGTKIKRCIIYKKLPIASHFYIHVTSAAEKASALSYPLSHTRMDK